MSPTGVAAAQQTLRLHSEVLHWQTDRGPQFIDITDDIEAVIARAGISAGQVLIYSQHTTASIKVLEHEPQLLLDLESMLRRIAPPDAAYFHNDFNVRTVNMCPDEFANAHAHCQHLVLGTSETVPVMRGQMCFGPWQRIFLIELDRARLRHVVVQVLGM